MLPKRRGWDELLAHSSERQEREAAATFCTNQGLKAAEVLFRNSQKGCALRLYGAHHIG